LSAGRRRQCGPHRSASPVINLGECQQPAGEGCILGLFGRDAKLLASEVSAKGDWGGMANLHRSSW